MNTEIVYCGMDVAKATLELAGPAGGRTFPNTPRGHAQLLGWLASLPGPVQVVCEATGAYERAVTRALQAASVAVSVTNQCHYCIASHTVSAQKKGMTDAMFKELMAVVGMANETNKMVTGYQVEIDEQFKK